MTAQPSTAITCSFAEYRKIDAVNWSSLREMRRSPAHYRYGLDHPREDTTRLGFGRGAHGAILEPDRFALDFAVFKGPRRAGQEWQAFKAVHAADTILKASEYERCLGMRDAVRAHPTASRYLASGRAELAIIWTDPETGLRCKARLDWLSDAALVDLKTTEDLARFGILAARLGYPCQLAFYLMGLRALGLAITLAARIIVVETKAPHAVRVLALTERDRAAGERECVSLLRQVADCRAKKAWPAGDDGEQVLEFPSWATGGSQDDDLSSVGFSVRKVG